MGIMTKKIKKNLILIHKNQYQCILTVKKTWKGPELCLNFTFASCSLTVLLICGKKSKPNGGRISGARCFKWSMFILSDELSPEYGKMQANLHVSIFMYMLQVLCFMPRTMEETFWPFSLDNSTCNQVHVWNYCSRIKTIKKILCILEEQKLISDYYISMFLSLYVQLKSVPVLLICFYFLSWDIIQDNLFLFIFFNFCKVNWDDN